MMRTWRVGYDILILPSIKIRMNNKNMENYQKLKQHWKNIKIEIHSQKDQKVKT